MELYPVTKFNSLKLPEYFPESKKYLKLNEDDEFQDRRSLRDLNCDVFATIKTDKPIPCCTGIYYFEIRLLMNETLGFIGLGMGSTSCDENQQLGKGSNSVGLYVTNGRSVSLLISDKEYPIAISEKTRVQNLGIGINFLENYVFCTINGMLLLPRFDLPPKEKFLVDFLYPAVSSQSPNCSFSVNLGNDLTNNPFSFNFQCFRAKELKSKRVKCLSQEFSPNLAFVSVYNLVSDYLLHHGYAEAWGALNKYDHSQSKDQSLETIKNRRLIQKCILNQDFLEAISNIKRYFPDFFTQYPIYEFILKCRHFINLIIKKPVTNGVSDDQDYLGTSPKSLRLDPLLMKHRKHTHMTGYKVQAAVAMELSDECENNNRNGVPLEGTESDDMFTLNNTHGSEYMDTDSNIEFTLESDVPAKVGSCISNSSDHMVGDHVMYIIKYGKKLKEEAQAFCKGVDMSQEQRHGIDLLTRAFSLIAYRDPYSSPFKDMLGSHHMEELAHKINGAINGMLGDTTKARLDSLLDHCLTEVHHSTRHSPLLASIHPRLLMAELLNENQ